jgi:hypothetical protein
MPTSPRDVCHDGTKGDRHGHLEMPCCTGDEGGPLGIGLQDQVSNRRKLHGSRARCGERSGKRQASRVCQVGIGKTNASEPSMKCRKGMDVIETRLDPVAWDKVWGKPAYCPDGGRHKGGVILIQAPVRNVGTCRPDAKGGPQVEDPQGAEYRCGARGRINP